MENHERSAVKQQGAGRDISNVTPTTGGSTRWVSNRERRVKTVGMCSTKFALFLLLPPHLACGARACCWGKIKRLVASRSRQFDVSLWEAVIVCLLFCLCVVCPISERILFRKSLFFWSSVVASGIFT